MQSGAAKKQKEEGGEGQACIVELTYVFECTFILVSLQFIFRRIRFNICVELAIFNFCLLQLRFKPHPGCLCIDYKHQTFIFIFQ